MNRKRLAIAYVVPGHNLLASAGPTRNVLSLARALAEEADVTVAFRRSLEPFVPKGFRVVEMDPELGAGSRPVDDAAARGVGVRGFFRYVGKVARFVDREAPFFDLLLEKSWLLSGFVSARSTRAGVPGILIENIPPLLHRPVRGAGDLARSVRHRVARGMAGRYARRASRIIVETEELKDAIARGWRIPPESIDVVGLGIDRELFRPGDRAEARAELAIDPDAVVLLYAGVLDETHTLVPLLRALGETPLAGGVLHIAGDGRLRPLYDELAGRARIPIVFHGRLPHERMPRLLAASDLCLAPYDSSVFPDGRVVYSTLKIPEYLASGRPVVSVPSGNILRLVKDGVTGFLFPNEADRWASFFRAFPSRARLREMGEAAARGVVVPSWSETAARYLEIGERAAIGRHGDRARRESP